MHWHLYPHSFTLYGYDAPGGFQARSPYEACGQVAMIGSHTAWIYATLRNGQPLSPRDWRDVARLLSLEKGVSKIMAERGGDIVTWETARSKPGEAAQQGGQGI